MRALELLDPGISAGYAEIATDNADEDRRKFFFEFNMGMREEVWGERGMESPGKEGMRIVGVEAGDMGQQSVHRAHFLDVLAARVPQEVVRFGKRVERVEMGDAGEKMVVWFADGTSAEADAVIGCDGVKSVTRRMLLGADSAVLEPTFSHKYAYRGLVPMEKAVEAVGEALARNAQQYLGHHGHVLTFPIEKGKTLNVVAFQSKDGDWEDERWVLPTKKEDMINEFAGFGESVQRILSVRTSIVNF